MEISPQDKTMAMVAHLSGLSGYVVPLGGALVPICIWLVHPSPVVKQIAKQALWLNVMAYVGALLGVLVMYTVIGIPCAIVGWIALAIAVVVLPVIGAIKASDGRYYQYPVLGLRLNA